MKYNYSNLSDFEFEELCRDIISKKEGVFFESFKKGRDGGIDLRYSRTKKNAKRNFIIVQCKHYIRTGFPGLKSDLLVDKTNKKSELSKVKKIFKNKTSGRYILMCSVELNPTMKDDILNGFEGYIKSTGDILGLHDIEGLIDPSIEKKHYKLWLNSYTVVESFISKGFNEIKNLFNKGIKNRSNYSRKDILNEMQKFVAIPKINDAVDSLTTNNVVIISGEPGIGKSTLAKVLLLPYFSTNKGYEFIEISKDIEEANDLCDHLDKKQIFFYDDFLGKSAYQGGNKNEAKRINQFIKLIKASKNKKLIFTTREYILRDAQDIDDDFSLEGLLDTHKMLINIDDYSLLVKGKILYNHIYFSDLGKDYTDQIFFDKKYLKVIQHKNYSPRLIEQLTNKNLLDIDGITKDNYIEFVFNTLDNPHKLWMNGYQNIDNLSQKILIVLNIYERGISYGRLWEKIKIFIGEDISELDFRRALKIIDSSFISIGKGSKDSSVYSVPDSYSNDIQYKNPSISDFILKEIITKDLDLIKVLIEKFMHDDSLLDYISRYFSYNEVIKSYFIKKYSLYIANISSIEERTVAYIDVISTYSKIIPHLNEFKAEFLLFINKEVLPHYPDIVDKTIFLDVFYIHTYCDSFTYFQSDDGSLDSEKLENFKIIFEQDLIRFEAFNDQSQFTKLCYFYHCNELSFDSGDLFFTQFIEHNGLMHLTHDNYSSIESKLVDLENIKYTSISTFFDSQLNEIMTDLVKEKENTIIPQEDQDIDNDFEFSQTDNLREEINEIENLFDR